MLILLQHFLGLAGSRAALRMDEDAPAGGAAVTLATLVAGSLVLLLVLRRRRRQAAEGLRVSQAWLDAHHGGGRDQ